MSEKMPMPETIKPQDELSGIRDRIVELVRERQLEDPLADSEVLGLIQKWTIDNESLLEKSQDRMEQIQFEVQRAKLYFKIGLFDDSWTAFEDAVKIAKQEGFSDLANKIVEEWDKLNALDDNNTK